MNRRNFLLRLGQAAVAASVLDVDELFWKPGAKTFFLPSLTAQQYIKGMSQPDTSDPVWGRLKFHKDAFSLVSASLPMPEQVCDKETGISIRFVKEWDIGRIDALYGMSFSEHSVQAVIRDDDHSPEMKRMIAESAKNLADKIDGEAMRLYDQAEEPWTLVGPFQGYREAQPNKQAVKAIEEVLLGSGLPPLHGFEIA